MSGSITIDYYTDILCVWVWMTQPRLNELNEKWEDQILVRHRYLDIFNDADRKIRDAWRGGEGFTNFSAPVRRSAEADEPHSHFGPLAVHSE